jgi:hypothetical protein
MRTEAAANTFQPGTGVRTAPATASAWMVMIQKKVQPSPRRQRSQFHFQGSSAFGRGPAAASGAAGASSSMTVASVVVCRVALSFRDPYDVNRSLDPASDLLPQSPARNGVSRRRNWVQFAVCS